MNELNPQPAQEKSDPEPTFLGKHLSNLVAPFSNLIRGLYPLFKNTSYKPLFLAVAIAITILSTAFAIAIVMPAGVLLRFAITATSLILLTAVVFVLKDPKSFISKLLAAVAAIVILFVVASVLGSFTFEALNHWRVNSGQTNNEPSSSQTNGNEDAANRPDEQKGMDEFPKQTERDPLFSKGFFGTNGSIFDGIRNEYKNVNAPLKAVNVQCGKQLWIHYITPGFQVGFQCYLDMQTNAEGGKVPLNVAVSNKEPEKQLDILRWDNKDDLLHLGPPIVLAPSGHAELIVYPGGKNAIVFKLYSDPLDIADWFTMFTSEFFNSPDDDKEEVQHVVILNSEDVKHWNPNKYVFDFFGGNTFLPSDALYRTFTGAEANASPELKATMDVIRRFRQLKGEAENASIPTKASLQETSDRWLSYDPSWSDLNKTEKTLHAVGSRWSTINEKLDQILNRDQFKEGKDGVTVFFFNGPPRSNDLVCIYRFPKQ